MHSHRKLMEEAVSLPVELRTQLVDELLKSLNPSRVEIDDSWAVEAENRVADIKQNKVQTVAGEEVFEKIRKTSNGVSGFEERR